MEPSPFVRVDHLVIAVRDLEASTNAYAAMLGRAPSWRGRHPTYGTANALFALGHCYLELLACGVEPSDHPIAATLSAYLERRAEGLFAIALGCDDLEAASRRVARHGLSPSPIRPGEGHDAGGAVRQWRSFMLDRSDTRGLAVIAIQHDGGTLPSAAPTADSRSVVDDVDHVVLFSDDLAGALALWRDVFGAAERWRRELPERGTVNVGLRLGGVTLEVVAPLGQGGAGERGERAWGLAYTVGEADAAVRRLRSAGVPASDARDGLAPRTRVATVKWEHRLPTLLIEHRGRDPQM